MSRKTIIADASCLIVLQNIQELQLLQKLFGEIFITEEIEKEFGIDLPEWIKVKQIKNQIQHNALTLILDKGEASAIALCLENPTSLLIIDEKKGRRIAQELNLKILGTLGVILRAKEIGAINSIADLLMKLEKAQFRISENLKLKILENDQKLKQIRFCLLQNYEITKYFSHFDNFICLLSNFFWAEKVRSSFS